MSSHSLVGHAAAVRSRTASRAVFALLLTVSVVAACATGPRVHVRVVDEAGKPLAGAKVEASVGEDFLVYGLFQGCTGRELAHGETDGDGSYGFTCDDSEIRPAHTLLAMHFRRYG
jgi:hypothetical protein